MPELTFLRFLLIILATSRITHILQNEDSPFHLIERFRDWIEEMPSNEVSFVFTLQKWFGCVYCGSVIVGIMFIPLVYFIAHFFNFEILVDYVLAGFGASQLMLFFYISLPKYYSNYLTNQINVASKLVNTINSFSNTIKKSQDKA